MFYSNTREESRGKGVLIYTKDTLNFAVEEGDTTACEMLHGKLQTESDIIPTPTCYFCVPTPKNKLKFVGESQFISYLLNW